MHVVFGIWTVGLPHIHLPSSTDDATKHIQNNTDNILEWLSYLAKAITEHKDTIEYQTQKRKSGETKEGGHGLTAAENEERTKARKYEYAKQLSQQWKSGALTYWTCTTFQWNLLRSFWNGELQEIKRGKKLTMPSFDER